VDVSRDTAELQEDEDEAGAPVEGVQQAWAPVKGEDASGELAESAGGAQEVEGVEGAGNGKTAKDDEAAEGDMPEGEAKEEEEEGEVVVKEKVPYEPGAMAAEFKQLLKAFVLAETKSIDPTELVKVIKTHPQGEEFCDGGQHDCQEIMRLLMDSLHEDLKVATSQKLEEEDPDEKDIPEREKADRAWRRYLSRDQSPITDLFCGQLQSSITCHKCETRCTMYEPFWDLSIPITKDAMNKKGLSAWFSSEPSLVDCLRAFTADEVLSGDEGYRCDTCKEVTTATKRLRIHRFPNTLIVHMKRFRVTMTEREKISHLVQYPVTDLRLHEFGSAESGMRRGGATYDLVGSCMHTGTMLGGHYTSACRVEEAPSGGSLPWQLFNDETVGRMHPGQLVSAASYILFYALRPFEEQEPSKKERRRAKKEAQQQRERGEAGSSRHGEPVLEAPKPT